MYIQVLTYQSISYGYLPGSLHRVHRVVLVGARGFHGGAYTAAPDLLCPCTLSLLLSLP